MEEEAKVPPKWKEFEDLIARIQEDLAPSANLEQHVLLPGKKSGTKREVDICIRHTIGQIRLLVVIECKDWAKPVDLPEIGSFIDLVCDVGANKGVMVSARGFTNSATTRGREAGIDLYTPVDAAGLKWGASLPVIIEDARLKSFALSVRWSGTGADLPPDSSHMVVYRSDGSALDSVRNLVLDRWNDGTIPETEGEHDNVVLTKEETYLRVRESLIPARITVSVRVEIARFAGDWPLAECVGLHDASTGALHTTEFKTADLDFALLDSTWQRIEQTDLRAVQPAARLRISSCYPRLPVVDLHASSSKSPK